MKLIPKYQEGRKVYQYRRYGDLKSPTNARVLDEAGLKVSPNEDTPILTNEDGVPINRNWLVANGYYSQTPSGDIINNTPLNEVVKVASKDYPNLDFYRTESGTYRIPFHDSFINANSAEEAIKLLQKAKSEYSDPSENFLNNAMAGGAGLVRTGLAGAASLLKDAGKTILKSGKEAVLFPIKHPYRFAFDTAFGATTDALANQKFFNGKSLVDVTSEKTGLPDWAVNLGIGMGSGMLSDKLMAAPFGPYINAYRNVLKNPKSIKFPKKRRFGEIPDLKQYKQENLVPSTENVFNSNSYSGNTEITYNIAENVKNNPLIKISPHVVFDPKTGIFFNSTIDNFIPSIWYPEELMHRVNPDAIKVIQLLRNLSKKPMPRITLKGPSYPKNGRTYQLQSPSNWERIQNLRLANGAEERLIKQGTRRPMHEKDYALYLKERGKTHSRQTFSDFIWLKTRYGYAPFEPGVVRREYAAGTPNFAGVWSNSNRFEEGVNRAMEYSPAVRAHERVHFHYFPTEGLPYEAYDQNVLDSSLRQYLFETRNGTESSARLSQLKNAAGLTTDEEVTPELFEFFRDNYSNYFGGPHKPFANYYNVPEYLRNQPELKNQPYEIIDRIGNANIGMGNDMEDWFKAIPPEKVKAFLKWANKHSVVATGAIAAGAAALQKNNEQPSNEQ